MPERQRDRVTLGEFSMRMLRKQMKRQFRAIRPLSLHCPSTILSKLEPVVGLEPTTDGLQNRCSTTELNWLTNCSQITYAINLSSLLSIRILNLYMVAFPASVGAHGKFAISFLNGGAPAEVGAARGGTG